MASLLIIETYQVVIFQVIGFQLIRECFIVTGGQKSISQFARWKSHLLSFKATSICHLGET